MENDALRDRLKLNSEQGGMMVTQPDSDDDSYPLREFDVLTHLGDFGLDRQGKIQIEDDLKLTFHYAVPKLAKDGLVPITLWRNGESLKVDVPVAIRKNWLVKPLRGAYPSYFVYGPLVFTTPSQDLLARFRGNSSTILNPRENPLMKRRFDKPAFDGEQIVILGARLFPHRINSQMTSERSGK